MPWGARAPGDGLHPAGSGPRAVGPSSVAGTCARARSRRGPASLTPESPRSGPLPPAGTGWRAPPSPEPLAGRLFPGRAVRRRGPVRAPSASRPDPRRPDRARARSGTRARRRAPRRPRTPARAPSRGRRAREPSPAPSRSFSAPSSGDSAEPPRAASPPHRTVDSAELRGAAASPLPTAVAVASLQRWRRWSSLQRWWRRPFQRRRRWWPAAAGAPLGAADATLPEARA